MKNKFIFFIILVFYTTAGANGRKYIFERISIQDGLSQSTIYDIFQDNIGFIWFCTDNGLNRYDGRQFKKYFSYDDSLTSISSNRIYCGAKDSYGYLWFGTEMGLNRFDPQTTAFTKFYSGSADENLSGDVINYIYEDRDSVLWVCTTEGLNKYNRQTNTFAKINFDDKHNRVNFILEGRNDSTLWIGTSFFGLYELNKYNLNYKLYQVKVKTSELDFDNNINSMEWIGGNIYLGTDAGLVIFNSPKKEFVDVKSVVMERHSFSTDRITDIEIMPDSSIWLATRNDGIIVLDKNKTPVTNFKYDYNKNSAISNNRILKIFVDKQGIVWIGTYSGGINKYDKTIQKFNHYSTEKTGLLGLTYNDVWQLYEDSRRNIWICSEEGLSVYNKNKKFIKHFNSRNSNLSNDNVLTVAEDSEGNYWIGTLNGLNKYEFKTGKIYNYYSNGSKHKLSSNAVTYLYADKKNVVWVGTAAGLNKIQIKENGRIEFEDELLRRRTAEDFITNIIEDGTGKNLWVGTLSGLKKINKETFEVKIFSSVPANPNSISSDKIYGLLRDSFNNLWVCTLGGGVNKYIPGKNIFIRYRESDGLSNDLVYGIIEDKNKILWMSTNYGITRFDPFKNEFTKYDVANGLQSNEFNYNSYMQTKDGEIFFGGVNGINSFYPDKISRNELKPETKITSFKIYNKEISPVNDPRLKKDITFAKEVVLDYNENIFTIEFSSLNFSSPQKNQYRYKIEGLYDDWVYTGNRNFASFSNIPPGTYLFRVKGSNNDNVWDEKGASLYIKIMPPLWRSWWAYVLYVILFGAVASLFVYLKLSSQKREIDALQKADKLKSEFLAQMSHEIRTPINVILSFAGLLKEEMKEKVSEDLKMGFQSIGNAGKRIIRTIDLILNMSEIQSGTYDYKPEAINLFEDILLKLSIEFRKMAEQKGLKLEIIVRCGKPIIYADPYTVEQIFANLLDNAIKFTEKGNVRINLVCSGRTITTEVIDTGKGIKQEYLSEIFSPFSQEEQGYTRRFEGNGLGLSLVKKYCEINNATIDIESEAGKGTKFIVVFEKYELAKNHV